MSYPTTEQIRESFEKEARKQKVEKLVRMIDALAIQKGFDPTTDGDALAGLLRRLDTAGWEHLAKLAAVNWPSEKSQGDVIKTYEERQRLYDGKPRFRVRYYSIDGIRVREFRDKAKAEEFAEGQRLHGRKARVEECK